MYKVFVNDRPLILTSSQIREENYSGFFFNINTSKEIIHKLKFGKLQGAYIFSDNLQEDWMTFCDNYPLVIAAGGIVLNEKKEILFIYRRNKWDLPKGKKENNETIEQTALREIKEESGVKDLIIDSFLLKTYHLFYERQETKLKETNWFFLHTKYSGALTPQQKEGITNVAFKSEKEITKILPYTYTNTRLVYKAVKEFL